MQSIQRPVFLGALINPVQLTTNDIVDDKFTKPFDFIAETRARHRIKTMKCTPMTAGN